MQQALPTLSIPRVVPMPGHTIHLHIFEPRYRRLVEASQTTQSQVVLISQGIRSNPWGEPPKVFRTVEEFLSVNHSLYEPAAIGGVGRLAIEAKHSDGRSHVSIEVLTRAQLCEQIAAVPFSVYTWKPLPDLCQHTSEEQSAQEHLVLELLSAAQLLLSQAGRTESVLEALGQKHQPSLSELTFLLLKSFALTHTDAQAHLEDRSAISRGQRLLAWLCDLMARQASSMGTRPRIHPSDWADVSLLSQRRSQKERQAGGASNRL